MKLEEEAKMRVLKIKAYQLLANYRKPMSYNFWDTYPLPPFSTVKGWFHRTVEADNYIPSSICIQGKLNSVVYDLQTLVKFDRFRKEKQRQVILDGFNKALSHSPTFVASVFDIYLNIYLVSDESYLERFLENIFKIEYPYLGRHEDLVRVDYIDFIEVEKKSFSMFEKHKVDYGIYLKAETASKLDIEGIHYRMTFKYELINDVRYFSKVDVVYTDNSIIDSSEFWFDPEEERILDFVGDYDIRQDI